MMLHDIILAALLEYSSPQIMELIRKGVSFIQHCETMDAQLAVGPSAF